MHRGQARMEVPAARSRVTLALGFTSIPIEIDFTRTLLEPTRTCGAEQALLVSP